MIKHMKKELFILPFDHRTSFVRDILELKTISRKTEKRIKELKQMIFAGFLLSVKDENKKSFGLLVDEKFGESILKTAKKKNIIIALPVEKSGTKELKLEYGNNFKEHVNKFRPDYVKILVRYNPKDKGQIKTLKKINDFAKKEKYKIILELLAPPPKRIKTIKELMKVIDVDIWKLEGADKKLWSGIFRALDKNSKVIVLGRGENKAMVEKWLKTAKPFPEIIGFAIGRTVFAKPLIGYDKGKISKTEAIKQISGNFNHFLNLWQRK
jgi:5-dehydro-2-deoxygluconokinase